MGKWIVLAVVIVGAGLWGLRKYTLDHATEEDSFAGRIYDKRIEKELSETCSAAVKKMQAQDEETTPAQFAATCRCFVDDMSEKLNDVPPGELKAFLQKEETMKSAQSIIKKCGYAAGLN